MFKLRPAQSSAIFSSVLCEDTMWFHMLIEEAVHMCASFSVRLYDL